MSTSFQQPFRLALIAGVCAASFGCAAMMHEKEGIPWNARETGRAVAQVAGDGINGTVTFTEFENGDWRAVRVVADIQGQQGQLKPGKHAFHIHATGDCGDSFKAAGGHYDPGPHGMTGQPNHPYHMGDLPNLVVDASGHGRLEALTSRVTISPGPLTLFDADGSAVMIHAEPDGFSANQMGGDRIACGIVRQVR